MINIDKLIIFGLLHCRGDLKEKADVFFGVIKYGGRGKHDTLDKDDAQIAATLISIQSAVTCGIFSIMEACEDADGSAKAGNFKETEKKWETLRIFN